jgi:hypothetical protein
VSILSCLFTFFSPRFSPLSSFSRPLSSLCLEVFLLLFLVLSLPLLLLPADFFSFFQFLLSFFSPAPLFSLSVSSLADTLCGCVSFSILLAPLSSLSSYLH